MSTETKEMLDEILVALSKRAGPRVSFSNVAEAEILQLHRRMKTDPEGALDSITEKEISKVHEVVRAGHS